MSKSSYYFRFSSVALTLLCGLLHCLVTPGYADDRAADAKIMIRAINSAVSFQAGLLHEVEATSDGFEVKIFNKNMHEFEVKVDSSGSKVIKERKRHRPLSKRIAQAKSKELLSAQQFIKAIEASSKQYPASLVQEVEVENINSKRLLKVKLIQGKDKHAVYVSPDGNIVSFK